MNVKTKKASKTVEIGLLIDESGSMGMARTDTIGSINNFIRDQKTVKGKANITIASFNENYKLVIDKKNIQEVEEITEKDYKPNGYTALYDSLMKLIASLEETNAKKVIIAVMTDGMENASKEFSADKIHLIKEKVEQKQKDGWQILFLAADLDVKEYAGSLGVNLNFTQTFSKSAVGLADASSYLCRSVTDYRKV